MISYKGCDMIAMKREVAARVAGFPWSECQVRKLATSHCTIKEFCFKKTENQCGVLLGHTRKRVQSPLVVLGLKVRKGGDFFYGKSSNENHSQGL